MASDETGDSSFEGSKEETSHLSWAKTLFAEAKEDLDEDDVELITEFEQALTAFSHLLLSSQTDVVHYGEAKRKRKGCQPYVVGELVAQKIKAQSQLEEQQKQAQSQLEEQQKQAQSQLEEQQKQAQTLFLELEAERRKNQAKADEGQVKGEGVGASSESFWKDFFSVAELDADRLLELVALLKRKFSFARRAHLHEGTLLFSDDDFGRVWERDDVLRKVAVYIESGATAVDIEASSGKLLERGICATMAARGCGKSFLLDKVAQMRRLQDENGKDFLSPSSAERMVSLCIDFNKFAVQTFEEALCGATRFHSRLIHAAFFDVKLLSFLEKTREVWKHWKCPGTGVIVSALRKHYSAIKDPIFVVCVDEAMSHGEEAQGIFRAVKDLLDYSPRVRAVVTTFDDHTLNDSKTLWEEEVAETGSSRPIHWLPLLSFQVEKVCRYFEEEQSLPVTKRILHYLVSLSNGHPRSVVYLKKIFESRWKRDLKGLLSTWEDDIISTSSKVFGSSDKGERLFYGLLARTLCCEKLKVQGGGTINLSPDLSVSLSRLLVCCVLVNPVNPAKEDFVPTLSVMRVHHWADGVYETIARPIKILMDTGSTSGWEKFERFHLTFEALREWGYFYLYGSVDKDLHLPADSWYKDSTVLYGKGPIPVLKLSSRLSSSRMGSELEKHLSGLNGELNLDYRRSHSTNQPGFDIVTAFGDTIVFTECKFSGVGAGTRLQPSDITSKLECLEDQLDRTKATYQGRPISEYEIVIVFASLWKFSVGNVETAKATLTASMESKRILRNSTVLMLSEEALLSWYGPTFRELGRFRLSNEELNDISS